MARSNKKIENGKSRMEVLEKRVLYSADPVLAPLIDTLVLTDEPSSDDYNFQASDFPLPASKATELVIVDAGQDELDSLYKSLRDQYAGSTTQVVAFDAGDDPFAALSQLLEQYSDLDAIHLLSFGADGEMHLGNHALGSTDFEANASQVEQWGQALTSEGDLLLYGCNLSATLSGQELASTLSTLMRADVASSDDITGHSSLGGDWDLEIEFGELEAKPLLDQSSEDVWVGKLDITSDLFAHYKFNDGTANDSIGNANGTLNHGPNVVPGILGDGISFASVGGGGENSHIVIPDAVAPDLSVGDATLSFWVFSSTLTAGTLIDHSDATNGFKINLLAGGRIQGIAVDPDGGLTTFNTTATVAADTWTLVTATHTGSTVDVYVDDALVDLPLGRNPFSNPSNDMFFGMANDDTNPFDGAIDDVRFYNRYFTAADVDELILLGANTEEVVSTNNTFTVSHSAREVISNTDLQVSDAEQSSSEISYSIDSVATNYSLYLNDSLLGVNDTFTQQDIDTGVLKVQHNGAASGAEVFGLTVNDGLGYDTSFDFTVQAAANLAPTDIVQVQNPRDGLEINVSGGDAAYFSINDAPSLFGGLDQITYEVDFETSSFNPPSSTLISFGDNSVDRQFQVKLIQSSGVHVQIANESWLVATSAAKGLMDGNRHSLAVTWDVVSGEAHVIIDGQLISSNAFTPSTGLLATGIGTIGNDIDASTDASFSGKFHDVRVFDYVRSVSEIAAERSTEFGLNEAGLVGYWTFDSLSSDKQVASKTSLNTLTLEQSTHNGAVPGTVNLSSATIAENSANGSVVMTVQGIDPERENLINDLVANNSQLYFNASLGTFLQLNDTEVDWQDAYSDATNLTLNGASGYLGMPDSMAENEFYLSAIADSGIGNVWLGANSQADPNEWFIVRPGAVNEQFSDANGASINGNFVNWAAGEPNNINNTQRYAEFYHITGEWNDDSLDGGAGNRFFAEYELDEVLNGVATAGSVQNSLTYRIASQSTAGAFAIDPDSGVVTVADSSLLVYETTPNFTVDIEVLDGNGATFTKTFSIDLKDVDEPSTHNFPLFFSVNEDEAKTIVPIPFVGGVSINDPDDNEHLTLTIGGTNGIITLSQSTGLTVINAGGAGQVNSDTLAGTLTVSGPLTNINQALNGVRFTPTPDYSGPASIQMESVRTSEFGDPLALVTTSQNNFTINAVEDDPVATDDSLTVNEGGSVSVLDSGAFTFIDNDTDADAGSTLTVSATTNPSSGTVTVDASNNFVYQHDGSETTTDSFDYTVSDENGNTDVGTVSVVVAPVNDRPVAVDDALTVVEGLGTSTLDGGFASVLHNDTDAEDGNNLTVTVLRSPSEGSLSLQTDGTFSYTHNGSETLSDSFTYEISDSDGATSAIATVSITVTPSNDAPVASNDAVLTGEGESVTANVLNNDSDVDGDPLSVSITTAPANGTAVVNPDGTITYTHSGDNSTSDIVSYQISDGNGAQDTAVLAISITQRDDNPVASNDTVVVSEGGTSVVDVVQNDVDDEGSALVPTLLSAPSNGSVVLNADNTYTYTHNGSESFTDSFTYYATDATGNNSQPAQVLITVTPVNDNPAANDDFDTVQEGGSLTISVLANDTDSEGDSLAVQIVGTLPNGTASVNADNSISFVHDGSEPTGQYEVINYQVTDGNGGFDTASVYVTVTALNDNPIAQNDSTSVSEGQSIVIDATLNDSDEEDAVLTPALVVQPSNGSVVVDANGNLVYTHDGGESTSDSFTYQVSDSNGAVSNVAIVSVSVLPINDVPVANDDAAVVGEGSSVTVNTLSNDVDNDLDTLTPQLVVSPQNGSVLLNADNSFSYTHNGSETSSDSFIYSVNDGSGGVDTARVSITINNVNDNPLANTDSAVVDEGNDVIISVLDNDTDEELSSLIPEIVTTPLYGVVTLNADNTYTYQHDGSETTSDSFTYRVADDTGAVSSSTTVNLTINPINDSPVAVNDLAVVTEMGTVLIDGLQNDTDEDQDVLTIQLMSAPLHGNVVINPDNSFSYTHNGTETSNDVFAYQISDGFGGIDSATVQITISNTNDAPVAVADSASVNENGTVSIDVLVNDTDEEVGDLTPTISSSTMNGSLVVNADNTITYTHDGSETTSDSFAYTITDENGGVSAPTTVTLSINPVNDLPVANDDAVVVNEAGNINIDVLANDTDMEVGTLMPTVTVSPLHGITQVNADNTISYRHDGAEEFQDQFEYTIYDSDGGTATAFVFINVTPVNDSAPDLSGVPVSYQVPENAAIGLYIDDLVAQDIDDGDVVSFSLVNDADGRFQITLEGTLSVLDGAKLNRELIPSHSVVVLATDLAGNQTQKSIEIELLDVVEPISVLNGLGPFYVSEGVPDGTVVGAVSAVASDDSGQITYALVESADGRFAIDDVSGELTVANAALLDFESLDSHQVVVSVTDATGTAIESQIDIFLVNEDESPEFLNTPLILSTPEHVPNDSLIGAVEAVDPEGLDLYYSIDPGDSSNLFNIDSETGEIFSNNAEFIDFERQTQHNLVVSAADIGGNITQSALQINVVDTDDPIVLSNPITSVVYVENAEPLFVASQALIDDVDSSELSSVEVTITNHFQEEDRLFLEEIEGISSQFDNSTGKLVLTGPASIDEFNTAIQSIQYLNLSDNPNVESRLINIVLNDDAGSSSAALVELQLIPVNDTPIGEPIITGSNIVGDELQVDVSGLIDLDEIVQYQFQWVRDGIAIPGETSSRYSPVESDVDANITVQVSIVDSNGIVESALVSAPQVVIADVPDLGAAGNVINTIGIGVAEIQAPSLATILTSNEDSKEEEPVASESQQESSPVSDSEVEIEAVDVSPISLSLLNSKSMADAFKQVINPVGEISSNSISRDIKLNANEYQEQRSSILSLDPVNIELEEGRRVLWQVENVGMANSIKEVLENISNTAAEKRVSGSVTDVLVGTSLSVTAGFLIWVLRGGALLASVFSVSPLWKQLDPLLILNTTHEEDTEGSEEDREVENLFDDSRGQ